MFSNRNIVFLDCHSLNPGDIDWAPIRELGQFEAYDRTPASKVVERSLHAEVLIVNKVRLGDGELQKLPHLRLICVAATGYDQIDVEAATRHGVVVCNVPSYSTESVVQHTMALLLEATNRVGFYSRQCAADYWSGSPDFCRWEETSFELSGKTATVVGFGNIGSRVAEVLHAMGLTVQAVTSRNEADLPQYVRKVSIDEAVETSDIVSLHCPLTVHNRHFVNQPLLEKARRGLVLLNTARGALVDDEAIVRAINEGRLGAYCTDVLSEEPPKANHPLLGVPNVYLTPHVAWATKEARMRNIDILVQDIQHFYEGNPINKVN